MTRMKSPPITPAAISGVLPTRMKKKKEKKIKKRDKTEGEKEQLCNTLSTHYKSSQLEEIQIKNAFEPSQNF